MTKTPRPFKRDDRENLVKWLYLLHSRAMDEKKYDVAKRSSLLIAEISHNWRSLTDPRKYPAK